MCTWAGKLRTAALGGVFALLFGCGGSPEGVVYFVFLRSFQETASFLEIQAELQRVGVVPVQIQCGYFDHAKLPPLERPAFADGRTPRLVYYTFSGVDPALLGQVRYPGFRPVPGEFAIAHSDPFDCGPLPE